MRWCLLIHHTIIDDVAGSADLDAIGCEQSNIITNSFVVTINSISTTSYKVNRPLRFFLADQCHIEDHRLSMSECVNYLGHLFK